MKNILKTEIAALLTDAATELEGAASSDALSKLCATHGIPFKASGALSFDEWTDMYSEAYREQGDEEGVEYLEQLDDNQEELEELEDLDGDQVMAQVEQLEKFAAQGKLKQYITVMEHQVAASTGAQAEANQLLLMMARAILEQTPEVLSASLRKLTAMV